MVEIVGLPADFDEAQITAELQNCEEDYNMLTEELTVDLPRQDTLEGKMYNTYADTQAHKVGNEKADIAQSKTISYGIKWDVCTWAMSHCLTPSERKYGKSREKSVAEGIMRARMHTMEREFVKTMCGPVRFCSDGGERLVDSRTVVALNDEPLTPPKLREAMKELKAGCPGNGDMVLMADFDTFDSLADADEFKNFDLTYGNGSALLGDVRRYPEFYNLKFREVNDRTTLVGDGTDSLLREPVFPVLPYTDPLTGVESLTHVVTFAVMYRKDTMGYENRDELCVTMKDNLPNKLKDLLIIDGQWTGGMSRLRTKNVVIIPCVTPMNSCKVYKANALPDSKFIEAAGV